MTALSLAIKAEQYRKRLCVEIPTRRVGSQGNQEATDFLSKTVIDGTRFY
jgi:hypothetical protein